eukprot:scpid61960/ scgid20319/ 
MYAIMKETNTISITPPSKIACAMAYGMDTVKDIVSSTMPVAEKLLKPLERENSPPPASLPEARSVTSAGDDSRPFSADRRCLLSDSERDIGLSACTCASHTSLETDVRPKAPVDMGSTGKEFSPELVVQCVQHSTVDRLVVVHRA